MTTTTINSARLSITFSAGNLPRVDHPGFRLMLGNTPVLVEITAKTARKLATHPGGAKLEGRLIPRNGNLLLVDAGFQLFDVKTAKAESVG
jgi:hypothetical protein